MAREIGSEQTRQALYRKREMVSVFFITVLFGIAYQDLVDPLRDAIQYSGGFRWQDLVLPAVFFLVSVRFFIGNQLHLLSDNLTELPGILWLYDFLMVIAEAVVIIYLARTASIQVSRDSFVGFIDVLTALYTIDVIWITSQYLMGLRLPGRPRPWNRTCIPWVWLYLNAILIAANFSLPAITKSFFDADVYGDAGLIMLGLANLLGFGFDVLFSDHYHLLAGDQQAEGPTSQ